MEINIQEENSFYIIQISGDIDASSSINLDNTINNAIQNQKVNLLIDGSGIDYISSAGLGVFMSYIKDFEEKKIFFVIFGLNDKVKNIFQILGLDELLTIVDTKQDAKELKTNDS